ncbi:diaminopimelate epimerase [Synechococcus sp. RSCCF101]|uniref:diaminopimelate epimerase n=1 Tax=Synechococcus sp. RSCCF101 TaxID=2511069 RepID=UPI001249038C|nr:diaminopimelate epimerase [Synechococcus sp. RSCCF101]QEY31714.1 diaminopimelate epimerase [Synechococcus sp. RSCCF101]
MLQFSKYQGLGNDFIIVDARSGGLPPAVTGPDPDWVRDVCDRRFGVGGDGVILALPPSGEADLRMRIFNIDGSEAEMCGNGIRCLARFLVDSEGIPPEGSWSIETGAGVLTPSWLEDGSIEVSMGAPRLVPDQVPTTARVGGSGCPELEVTLNGVPHPAVAVGMGNPHLVVPVASLDSHAIDVVGPPLEVHPAFPARTNVHLVEVLAPDHLRMRVWERGAGPTLACGTGACATLVGLRLLGRCAAAARVDLPGGPLFIRWQGPEEPVLMRGPAEPVFDGVLAPELTPPLPEPADAVQDRPAVVERPAVEAPQPAMSEQAPAGPTDGEADGAGTAALRFLEGHSLDEMIGLANDSLPARTLARQRRDGEPQA